MRQVKKFESGMVVNPVTIGPRCTLAEALSLMKAHGISGIPVVKTVAVLAVSSVFSPTAMCALHLIRARRSSR